MQVVPGFKIALLLPALIDAFVVSANSDHAPGFEEQLRACKSAEHRNSRFFHLAAEPLYEFIDGDDIVAMVTHWRRSDWELELSGPREEIDRFFDYRGVQWSFLLEARKQLAHG